MLPSGHHPAIKNPENLIILEILIQTKKQRAMPDSPQTKKNQKSKIM